MTNILDCIIVGSGSAGCTAAIYLGRSNKKVLLLTGPQKGGLLTTTHTVENFPGFPNAINGIDLMDNMILQAKNSGANIKDLTVITVEKIHNIFNIKLNNNDILQTKSIIWATGSTPRKLQLQSEKKYENLGISYCAVCDGPLYKNKVVCVVGGGNSAVEEALFLSDIATKVYLIHRRDSFRAEAVLQERLKQRQNIHILWNSVVEEFDGEDYLTKIIIKQQENIQTIHIDACFIAIGHIPNTREIKHLVQINNNGYVVAEECCTKTLGLFVAGDIHDYKYRQAITAASFGCIAAFQVNEYLCM